MISFFITITLPKLILVTIALRYAIIYINPASETLNVYDLLGLS